MPVLPFVLGWLILAVAPTSSVAASYPPSGEPIVLSVPGVTPFLLATTDLEAHQGAGTNRQIAKNGRFVLAEVTGPELAQHRHFRIAPAARPRNHIPAGAAGVRVALF